MHSYHYMGGEKLLFDLVKERYESTKPLVSSFHTKEQDVRPIGQRRYKHERIIKVDENTYALSDGAHCGHLYDSARTRVSDGEIASAPIVVERRADGDYIRVRNCPPDCVWITRYAFIFAYLPFGLSFRNNNGAHSVCYTRGNCDFVNYPFPKSDLRVDHSTGKVISDDGKVLWFKQTEWKKFERAGELISVGTKHVDRDVKKALKPHIKQFFEWMCIMAPMLNGVMVWDTRKAYLEELGMGGWSPNWRVANTNLMREVMTNSEHELRPALAAVLAWQCDMFERNATPQSVQASFNKRINKVLGLYKTELV